MYEERVYRNLFKGIKLEFFDVYVDETDLRIGAQKNLYKEALEAVKRYREVLKEYIRIQPEFLTSLKPVECLADAPLIARKMCEAAYKAGVGPMAAVAGAFSELIGLELLKYSDEIIVENGGDIFIKSNINRRVGIYAGKSPLSEKLAINIEPNRMPIGICTSSGTVGHSLSFGKADAAVILSKDTFVSDAGATAVGNMVKDSGHIEKALEFAASIPGVEGAVIIVGDKMGVWGEVKLTKF